MKSSQNKVLSPSAKPYKDWLKQAEILRAKGGKSAYERTKLLVAVYNDTDFRLDNGNIDNVQARVILDALVEDLAFRFQELAQLLERYPKADDWAEGKLRSMYEAMMSERPAPLEKPKPRRSARVAQVEDLKTQNKTLATKLKDATKKIAAVTEKAKTELETLREENKQLKARIAELEAENRQLKQQRRRAVAA